MNIKAISVVALCILCSCQSTNKEQTAKDNISKYLSTTMNDFKSYEPVKFGTLDTSLTTFDKSTAALLYEADKVVYRTRAKELEDSADELMNSDRKLAIQCLQRAKAYLMEGSNRAQALADSANAFRGVFDGYSMTHTFRGKNKMGALVITTKTFMLDSNLTVKDVHEVE